MRLSETTIGDQGQPIMDLQISETTLYPWVKHLKMYLKLQILYYLLLSGCYGN